MPQPTFQPPTGPSGASAVPDSASGAVPLETNRRRRTRHFHAARGPSRAAGATAVRSRITGALALTAISLAALTGAAAPASAATTHTAPHALITLRAADPSSQWVTTTDPTSGISVMLPGQPTLHKTTSTTDGKPITIRTYVQKLTDDHGAVVFMVTDAATGPADLDAAIRGMTSTVGENGTVTTSRHFVLDAHPALDGRFTFTRKDTPAVGLARFVSGGDHFVGIGTIGPIAQENALTQVHQQVLGTLQLPKPPR